MLNVQGNNKVYTVPEIDGMLKNMAGFRIVERLPNIEDAKETLVYYKKVKDKIQDLVGYAIPDDPTDISEEQDDTHTEPVYELRPALIPYIKSKDENDDYVWYTTGGATSDHRGLTEEEVLDIWNSYEPQYTSRNGGKKLNYILGIKE